MSTGVTSLKNGLNRFFLDLERRLYMGTGPEILDELKNETTQLQSTNEKLKNDLACSENKTRQVAQKLEQNAKAYSDQIADHVNI